MIVPICLIETRKPVDCPFHSFVMAYDSFPFLQICTFTNECPRFLLLEGCVRACLLVLSLCAQYNVWAAVRTPLKCLLLIQLIKSRWRSQSTFMANTNRANNRILMPISSARWWPNFSRSWFPNTSIYSSYFTARDVSSAVKPARTFPLKSLVQVPVARQYPFSALGRFTTDVLSGIACIADGQLKRHF